MGLDWTGPEQAPMFGAAVLVHMTKIIVLNPHVDPPTAHFSVSHLSSKSLYVTHLFLTTLNSSRPGLLSVCTHLTCKISWMHVCTGNTILKGSKESACTAAELVHTALPGMFIQSVEMRTEVTMLLSQDRYINLVIPHESNTLVHEIQHSTRILVMGHADGLCTIFLSMDREKVKCVMVDAKVCIRHRIALSLSPLLLIDYPVACNAIKTLLVCQSLLETIWPDIVEALLTVNVKLLCDEPTLSTLTSSPTKKTNNYPKFQTHILPASPEAYMTEYLLLTLAVHTVPPSQPP
jgi:glutamate-5-semialdehyde dehydrogenase